LVVCLVLCVKVVGATLSKGIVSTVIRLLSSSITAAKLQRLHDDADAVQGDAAFTLRDRSATSAHPYLWDPAKSNLARLRLCISAIPASPAISPITDELRVCLNFHAGRRLSWLNPYDIKLFVFTARLYASAVLDVVVCLSVRLSLAGIVSKWLNVESWAIRRTIAQGL